tara:strand:- start:199 stop:447 length:249 start_codon:yes stop_codon:yes gene_type:complete
MAKPAGTDTPCVFAAVTILSLCAIVSLGNKTPLLVLFMSSTALKFGLDWLMPIWAETIEGNNTKVTRMAMKQSNDRLSPFLA